jgi:RHS repeat-associated protein
MSWATRPTSCSLIMPATARPTGGSLSTDERGSVVSLTDGSGALIGIDTYDEYGKPGAANTGRFQYAGQKWLSEIGAYDYKARVYLPHLGIFAQTDPIGQASSPNLYAYVGGDPVNVTDPFGLTPTVINTRPVIITACQNGGGSPPCPHDFGPGSGGVTGGIGGTPGGNESGDDRDIQVVHSGCQGGRFVGGLCTPSTTPAVQLILTGLPATQDRCAAMQTPLRRSPLPYIVDPGSLATMVHQKFEQHSSILNSWGGFQSAFGGFMSTEGRVYSASAYLIMTRSAVAAGANNLRITGNLGVFTGFDRNSFLETTFMTVIIGPVVGHRSNLPERLPVSVYPGC